jgi:hypothetical protein
MNRTDLERMDRIERGVEPCPICNGTRQMSTPGLVAHLYPNDGTLPCVVCCPSVSYATLLAELDRPLSLRGLIRETFKALFTYQDGDFIEVVRLTDAQLEAERVRERAARELVPFIETALDIAEDDRCATRTPKQD